MSSLYVGTNHQDRIVARDGAKYVAPAFAIESRGHRLCSAHCRAQQNLVHRVLHFEAKAVHDLCNRRGPIVDSVMSIAVTIREGIAVRTFRKLQLVDIARERRLRHFEATPAELAPQFILIGNQGVRNELADRIVPLKLHLSFSGKAKTRLAIAAAALA